MHYTLFIIFLYIYHTCIKEYIFVKFIFLENYYINSQIYSENNNSTKIILLKYTFL